MQKVQRIEIYLTAAEMRVCGKFFEINKSYSHVLVLSKSVAHCKEKNGI